LPELLERNARQMATGLLFITSLAGVIGLRKVEQDGPPTQTAQSLKEDVEWAKTRKS
jgi:hypothetical protein